MITRRRLLKYAALAGAAAAGGASIFLPRKANAYYSGPVTDHFDGVKFFNPGGKSPKSFRYVANLYLSESWARWPARAESAFSDVPPPEVGSGQFRVAFVGHASWLLQADGVNILIDPVWSERASPVSFSGPKRVNAPGITFDRLPRIDVVIVTHNHYDHMDLATLGRLWQRHRPRIVTPLGNDIIMRSEIPELRADAVDWRQSIEMSPDLRIHTEATQHWSARGVRDRSHALWASFVIETRAHRVYAIGDTGFGDGRTFRDVANRHPKLDLALMPIGAYEPQWFMQDQHMNPIEAVDALGICGAKAALGHHWGTFQLTTEAHDRPVQDLALALQKKALPAERFHAVRPGEVRTLQS